MPSLTSREVWHMLRTGVALTILATTFRAAAAEQGSPDLVDAEQNAQKSGEASAIRAAASGGLSPFSVSPRVPRAANGIALFGYDSAAKDFRARSAVEGRLLSFLAARVEYEHGPANGPSDRLSLGLRAAVLPQAKHGVELGALAFYEPRDFRDEGDVVLGLLLARRFDRLTLVL